jgi:7-carboxy-7-deazaguanine synthase
MKKFKVNEVYSSIQGEGPRVGTPTIFARFSGCNMRCPAWPCDTPYAIYPDIWKHDPTMDVGEVVAKINEHPGTNVCITGGEPTMQPEELLEELVEILTGQGYTVDMFTNGSLKQFPDWIALDPVVVIMDWKLEGSGEAERGLDVRTQNVKMLRRKDAIKFVVASEDDLEEAFTLWKDMKGVPVEFYVGAAWNLFAEADLVNWILERNVPWKLNVQIHKYIFPDKDRGI